MGIYLDSKTAYTLYKNEIENPYFVDKSLMIKELFHLVREGGNYICITRPRRFGKTVMANMVASFFSRAYDSRDLFQPLLISKEEEYGKFLNQYPVIHISFNDTPGQSISYEQYIQRIEKRLIRDLKNVYPQVILEDDDYVVDVLTQIYAEDDTARFIFVLDEWDYIFHQDFVTESDKKLFLTFLRSLLKDRPYVLFTYMTGILPIAKYSSGSELNMFTEFTMAGSRAFSEFFGFTEDEVRDLHEKYMTVCNDAHITLEGLQIWYNGYYTATGKRVYNPRSVVQALKYNDLANYWTSSGPYDEIYYYIENNVAAVRNDIALMVTGNPVSAKIWEYAATSQNLKTREEILSAMVVYGFLSYENGNVSIPNKELMDKFADMLQREPSLGYIYRLAKESSRMLQATLAGDTDTMMEILEIVHDTETPLLSYNNEIELTAVVNLVYLAARDMYRVEREDKAGKGFVDFIFYPEINKSEDGIILELKIDNSPDEAIRQIKEKNYVLRFKGKIGEKPKYTGRILAVGICYDKTSKKHSCKIEVLV